MAQIAILTVFPAMLAFAAATDLLTMTISNWVPILLVVAFTAVAVLFGITGQTVLTSVIASGLTLLLFFGLFAFGWLGGGDAKLAAASALWLGLDLLLEYLLVTAVLGGMLTGMLLLVRLIPLPVFAFRWNWLSRLHDRRNGAPYGVALAGAALLLYPHSAIWKAAL